MARNHDRIDPTFMVRPDQNNFGLWADYRLLRVGNLEIEKRKTR